MRQLADEKLQITLALSLHATTDEKRRKLMPIANRYSIKELMEVCRYYFEQTGRRITFEYSLVGGVNDTEEDAKELIALAKPLCCHINLIPQVDTVTFLWLMFNPFSSVSRCRNFRILS